jgi:prevent-host-death family protein
MANESQVSVRQLKNEATCILRRVEGGERHTVTKRGKPVAVIEPLNQALVPASDSIYRSLQRQIEARTPQLRRTSMAAVRRDFERISRKIAGKVPCRDWREIDRAAKGEHFGLSR